MKKLYRSTLVAVVLAFGVVACGDDVQIVEPEPTPPPALQVTLTPQNVNLVVGDNVNLAVGISGGQEGAQVTITCESSNTDVVTTTASGNNCAVTAVGSGNATVTATVQKGNQQSSAGAAVQVQGVDDIQQATVTISDIMQGGTTADINNVSGQLDVRMNVNFGDEQPVRLNLYVDDDVVATQEFSQAVAAAEEGDDPEEQVQQITLSFNTDYYTIEDGVAHIRSLNGDRVISAELIVATQDAEPRASNTVTVRFNNDDGFHAMGQRPENSAMDADGRRWYGGPDTSTEITVVPVFFSGMTVQDDPGVTVSFCGTSQTATDVPYSFEFPCTGFQSARINGAAPAGEVPGIMAQYAEDGDDASGNILNDDHPFPFRLDVQGPDAATGSIVIVRQSGLNNTQNWVNDEYNFLQSGAYTRPTDDGVGGVTESLAIRDLEAGTVVAQEDLEESVTNQRYRLRVIAQDALGNSTTLNQSANPDDHPENTFGYDITPPNVEIAEDDDALGQIEGAYNFVQQFGTDDGIDIRATDNLAGFNQTYAAQHALITIRGQFQGEGAIETAALVAGSPAGIVSTPFEVARDGEEPIANLASVAEQWVDHIDQTAFRVTYDDFSNVAMDEDEGHPARYYLYQIRLRDQAGNTTKVYRAIYVNNFSQPVLQNLQNPSTFDAAAVFEASLARDSVEVYEGSLEVRYPNTEGSIVWERPTAGLSLDGLSELQMNATLPDGQLFSDVIYRPVHDVMFPTGFDALGIPFLKSVQTMDAASVATAKPDSVRARVFNGYGAQIEGLNHSAAAAGGSGVSALLSNPIVSEEVADPTIEYHNTDIAIFEIVDSSATDCNEWCVRAIGPLSTFTNPFAGGPVFMAWAEDDGAQNGTGVNGELQWRVFAVADANFSHPFPTRDSGADRIYEWTFSMPAGIPDGASIAAIGVNANTGDGLLVADFFEAPEPAFNVVFDQGSYDVEIDGGTVTMNVIHGTNSTTETFTVDACVFIDENGNTLVNDPDGLTLTVNGNACDITATSPNAELDSWTVQAQVTGVDSGAATAETTVVIGLPAFEISIDGPYTVEVPADGAAAVSQTFSVTVDSGEPISAMNCSLSPTAQGVSVVTSGTTCVVTVNDAASAGTFDVIAQATETDTGRTDTTIGVLNVEEVLLALDPVSTEVDPTEISWTTDTNIEVVVSGSRTNGDIDNVAPATGVTCTPSETWLDAPQSASGEGCDISINNVNAAAPGDYTVEFSVDFGDRVDVVTGHITVPEAPAFDPQLDFSLGGDATTDRRIIERDRTAFFEVLSGAGIGINLANSTADVSPVSGGVTAAVAQDVDGTYLLEVDVPLTADTGNYTVTVTFEEVGTGETEVVLVYITVTDTGTITVDGVGL